VIRFELRHYLAIQADWSYWHTQARICSFALVIIHITRGVVGLEHVGTAFPHLFLARERVPTRFCTSNVTWRGVIQKITLKHGCDLTDGLATRRFVLLVRSLHCETKRSSVEILVGKCLLYSNSFVQLFLFGVGSAFQNLFFNTAFTHLFKKVWESLYCGNGVPIVGGTGRRMGLGSPLAFLGGLAPHF